MQPPKESTKKLRIGQRVRVGDVLMCSEPFVAALDDSCGGQHCHHCHRKSELTPCPGCQCDHYCSNVCRSAAWPLHQHECLYLPDLQREGLQCKQRLLLKLVIKLKNGGDKDWVIIDDQLSRQFRHLAKHTEHYRADRDHCRRYEETKAVLAKHLPQGFLPSEDDLFDMFASLAVNMFYITDNMRDCIGIGLYIDAAIYDSSCRPNAFCSFDGCVMTVRSLVDIPSYRRDKVFLTYCEPLEPYEQRQELLWKHFFFECKCDRCTDDFCTAIEGAICCGNPACPYPVEVPDRLLNPPTPGLECELTPAEDAQTLSCPRCGYNDYPASTLNDYKELIDLCRTAAEDIVDGEPSLGDEDLLAFAWRQLLRLQQRTSKGHSLLMLHPLNIYWVQLLNGAAALAIETHHLEKAFNFMEMSLQGMQHYFGRHGQDLGITYFSMGKICIYLKRIKPALRYFKKAEKILKITNGPNHPLLVDELYPLIDATRAVKTVRKNPLSLNTFRNSAKRVALQQNKTYNWLYLSFGGLLLTMVCLGVSGVNASALV